MEYNIIIMHGPIIETCYIGFNTVMYMLENKDKYIIKFSDSGNNTYKRSIICPNGDVYSDLFDLDGFDDFSLEDLAQWTADNWCEIDEIIIQKG